MLKELDLGKEKVLNLSAISPKTSKDIWTKFARIVTNITAPPFLAIPSYIILALQDQERRGVDTNFGSGLAIAVAFGATLPVILLVILHFSRKISDIHISVREQRTIPFLCTIASFTIGSFLLWLVSGPGLLTAALICYTINTLMVMLINLRWKISVHATGVAGPLAVFTVMLGWLVAPLWLLVALVAWARVHLRAHTLGQVLAGSLLGYFFTLFLFIFVFHLAG